MFIKTLFQALGLARPLHSVTEFGRDRVHAYPLVKRCVAISRVTVVAKLNCHLIHSTSRCYLNAE